MSRTSTLLTDVAQAEAIGVTPKRRDAIGARRDGYLELVANYWRTWLWNVESPGEERNAAIFKVGWTPANRLLGRPTPTASRDLRR